MEKVLPGLHKKKLHELVLHKDNALATPLGRPYKGGTLSKRWAYTLQPWIMQYYAGTLNLDIRMMLVNHLVETYQSRESIDWDAVAAKSEFAGHTAINLKHIFSVVLSCAKKSLNSEISWDQILDRCREYISQARRCNSKNEELRRFQVIKYFENYVERHEIDDFL